VILVVRGGSSDNASWWSSTDGNDPRAIEFNLDMGVVECFAQKREPFDVARGAVGSKAVMGWFQHPMPAFRSGGDQVAC
jgi:hypothetical protein